MSIKIGINENVKINAIEINAKGTLEIELIDANEVKKSLFDASLTAATNKEGITRRLLFFLPNVAKDKDGAEAKTQEKKLQLISADFQRLIKQLTQIASQWLTTENIALDTIENQWAGTGVVDGPTFEERGLMEAVVKQRYDNIVKRFVDIMTKNGLVPSPEPIRFKLIRQAADKAFPTVPGSYLDEQPFIELMTIPKAQSRVKFSAYELTAGLDSDAPMAKDKSEKKSSSTGTTKETSEANPFA